jgi:predicted transcriptional regulator
MIEIKWEIMRSIAEQAMVARRIAGQLSIPMSLDAVSQPLTELIASGLVENFEDRTRTRYRLTDQGRVEYPRLLQLERQKRRADAGKQSPAPLQSITVHAS